MESGESGREDEFATIEGESRRSVAVLLPETVVAVVETVVPKVRICAGVTSDIEQRELMLTDYLLQFLIEAG